MRVGRVSLTNFRSYTQADIDLPPGITTFVGRNGRGKTNAVEAIRFLSLLDSHRVPTVAPLIHMGAEQATVRAQVHKNDRAIVLEATINSGAAKTLKVGGHPSKPRDFVGIVRTVLFAPEDLALVKGEPSTRRTLLDEISVALQPALAGDLADYDRVVRQRSTLLKSARGKNVDMGTLEVWDQKLVTLGSRITAARARTVSLLDPHARKAYADIAHGAHAGVTYAPSVGEATTHVTDIEQQFVEALGTVRAKERERGLCLVGPHRDELVITIGDLPAKGYASHGESWSAALALRLGTFDLLCADDGPHADTDGTPVLILDDVFAELDSDRRAALASRAHEADQVLVTAAVENDVPPELAGEVITVGDGTLTLRSKDA